MAVVYKELPISGGGYDVNLHEPTRTFALASLVSPSAPGVNRSDRSPLRAGMSDSFRGHCADTARTPRGHRAAFGVSPALEFGFRLEDLSYMHG